MKKYEVRWRRIKRSGWPSTWNLESEVTGHNLDKPQDKMVFYFEDGSIREVAKWADCEIRLGTDWVLAMKDQMERESNHPVKLNVNAGGK